MKKPIAELQVLATKLVGDGRAPDLFFVTDEKGTVITVTSEFGLAHRHWRTMELGCLENRQYGMIASKERNEKGRVRIVDDTVQFLRYKPKHRDSYHNFE